MTFRKRAYWKLKAQALDHTLRRTPLEEAVDLSSDNVMIMTTMMMMMVMIMMMMMIMMMIMMIIIIIIIIKNTHG